MGSTLGMTSHTGHLGMTSHIGHLADNYVVVKQGFIQALLLTPVFLKEDSVLVMHRYSHAGQRASGGVTLVGL